MIMDNLETRSFAETSNVVHFQHLLHFESSFIGGGSGGGGNGSGNANTSGSGSNKAADDTSGGLQTPTVASAAAAAAAAVIGTGSSFPVLRRSETNIFNDSLNTPISSFMDLPVFFSSTVPAPLAAVLPPPSVLEAGKKLQ